MTKSQFKKRIKALGLDPIQATVLFDFSHPARIYSQSEGVSSASEFKLNVFERAKKTGDLAVWLEESKISIDKMREKINLEQRKKYRKNKRSGT